MAQLAEWLLPIIEVQGSNPVISKLLYKTFVSCIEKTKIKKKRPERAHLKKFANKCTFSLETSQRNLY